MGAIGAPTTVLGILGTVVASGWAEFGGLVVFMLTWYWLGKVVSQSTHERELAMLKELADERKTQADEWKAVAEETNAQVKQLVPTMRLVADFFNKVPVVPVEVPPREVETGRSDNGST